MFPESVILVSSWTVPLYSVGQGPEAMPSSVSKIPSLSSSKSTLSITPSLSLSVKVVVSSLQSISPPAGLSGKSLKGVSSKEPFTSE